MKISSRKPFIKKWRGLVACIIGGIALFGCAVQSQFKAATAEQMKHDTIIEFPGISKDQIYERTFKWIAMNFKSAKAVVDYQDKVAGTIIAKGVIHNEKFNELSFTLTFDARDGKARFHYTNVVPIIYYTNGIADHEYDDDEYTHINADTTFHKMNTEISEAINTKDKF